MPDCFVSYTTQDQQLAMSIQSELRTQNLDVFMASVSLQPGELWPDTVLRNLRASSCVVFLASKVASRSEFVNQELGMAFGANKRVIPVLWKIAPSDLPGWAANLQAFNLGGTSDQEIRALSAKIAQVVREEKAKGPPEIAAWLAEAIKRIEAHAYESAIEILTQAVKLAPLAGDINYYVALALLKGKRPRSLFLSEADAVSRYLQTACTSDLPKAHYFYLWALVKFDFYQANGLRVGEPDVEECLIAAQDYQFDQDGFDQMVRHAKADEGLRSLGLI